MDYKGQYLDALSDFTKAVNIRKSMIDPKKEGEINRLTKEAIAKIQGILQSCTSIEDLKAVSKNLGLSFTEENIEQAAQKKPEVLLNAFMSELQLMLQEQIIPVDDYEVLENETERTVERD